jgi:hypothetical protein
MSVEWYSTIGKNIQATRNLARVVDGLTDLTKNPNYTPFTVFSPIDGHAVTMYDATSAALATTARNFTFTDENLTSNYNGFDIGINARLPRGARIFGGTTTERTITNNCDNAIDNPNSLLYCDQSNLEGGYTIPWKTQIKASATYPLPWFGLIANASYQGLPGYTLGQTTYSISSTSKYITCPGSSASAGCVPQATIYSAMVASSTSVPLDPSGTTLTPRTNQLDFGMAKRLRFGRIHFDPKFDLFNALNSDAYYSVVSTSFSPTVGAAGVNGAAVPSNASGTQFTAYHQPARFLQGRIVRLGFNMSW